MSIAVFNDFRADRWYAVIDGVRVPMRPAWHAWDGRIVDIDGKRMRIVRGPRVGEWLAVPA